MGFLGHAGVDLIRDSFYSSYTRVEAADPATFGVAAGMLIAISLVTSYLSALRASRTDPIEALRIE